MDAHFFIRANAIICKFSHILTPGELRRLVILHKYAKLIMQSLGSNKQNGLRRRPIIWLKNNKWVTEASLNIVVHSLLLILCQVSFPHPTVSYFRPINPKSFRCIFWTKVMKSWSAGLKLFNNFRSVPNKVVLKLSARHDGPRHWDYKFCSLSKAISYALAQTIESLKIDPLQFPVLDEYIEDI